MTQKEFWKILTEKGHGKFILRKGDVRTKRKNYCPLNFVCRQMRCYKFTNGDLGEMYEFLGLKCNFGDVIVLASDNSLLDEKCKKIRNRLLNILGLKGK